MTSASAGEGHPRCIRCTSHQRPRKNRKRRVVFVAFRQHIRLQTTTKSPNNMSLFSADFAIISPDNMYNPSPKKPGFLFPLHEHKKPKGASQGKVKEVAVMKVHTPACHKQAAPCEAGPPMFSRNFQEKPLKKPLNLKTS